jgi:hypothetical protein
MFVGIPPKNKTLEKLLQILWNGNRANERFPCINRILFYVNVQQFHPLVAIFADTLPRAF